MAVLMAFLLCVVCTFMGHSIFNWSLKFLSPCMVSSYRLCGPVFSALLAFLFFGERLQPLQLLGGLLILLGSQVYTRSEEKINACNLEQIPV
ncbi:hypothetical protein SDC9_166903 [bioreactor metagenome]|uniref:EamA domain-containing protein n=1 Tax=bioreactor metagenome TaxID=1076179 RepID=A0A645G0R3_9ZZZZ